MTSEIFNSDFSDFIKKYDIRLNEQQKAAVQTVDGANLLIAVPGSGKTTVLVARMGYMIISRNIPAENILSMTYTTSSAADMKKRFLSIFGEAYSEKVNFRTINSVCFEIIRYYSYKKGTEPFKLIDDVDRKSILRKIYMELAQTFPTENDIQEAESEITYIKNMMLTREKIKDFKSNVPQTAEFYERYDSILKKSALMDYDDQMRYALQILLRNPPVLDYFQNKFRYICVDEAQDTSKLQHTIIRLLSKKYNNIFMVGDEDQSIYGFRAAYPQALINFKNDYPDANVLFMERNYRSTVEIVDIAAKFISQNTERYEKKLIATREHGAQVNRTELSDRSLQYGFLIENLRKNSSDTAVLYRDNDCAIPLIDSLIRNNMPYYCRNFKDSFFTHKTVLDIKAFISLSFDPYNTDAFMQIYYKCNFGFTKAIAEQTVSKCRQLNITVFEALKSVNSYGYQTAVFFERFINNIRKYSSYDAICFIQQKYELYLQNHNISDSRVEIIKILARREPVLKNFIGYLNQLPELIKQHINMEKSGIPVLSTIHSSKGLEYDTVYIMDVYDGILPAVDNKFDNRSLFEEERRLFYVALTRAKQNLNIISFADRKSTFADEILPLKRPENPFKKHKIIESVTIKIDNNTYDKGKYVTHSIFGIGLIEQISELNENQHIIKVKFSGNQTKSFELETTLKYNLIKPMNK